MRGGRGTADCRKWPQIRFLLAIEIHRHASIVKKLLDCFYDVYHELGLGFLEVVYGNALAIALTQAGVPFRREFNVPVFFRGVLVGAYKADFLIADEIIVELKAARAIDPVHLAQLVNYLRGSKSRGWLRPQLRSQAVIQAAHILQ